MTEKQKLIIQAIEEKLGADIVVIDFADSSVADAFIIATGNVPSHTQAIIDSVESKLAKEGYFPQGREGYREANWILLDYGDIIVHVFLQQDRQYYALETLWQDQKVTHILEEEYA